MYESKFDILQILYLTFILLILCHFYLHLKTKSGIVWKFKDSLEPLFCVAGAVATYWLQQQFKISAVLAAGCIGLMASLLPYVKKHSYFLSKLPAIIYCGAFVGMTPPQIAGSYLFIILAALLASLLLMVTKGYFNGFGGKLGTIAFGGVVFISAIFYLFAP